MKSSAALLSVVLLASGFCPAIAATAPVAPRTGSVIFLHPDGAGTAAWLGLRFLDAGPDGRLNWDLLPSVAFYDGRMSDALSASSHGGATVHAYGVRVVRESYGMNGQAPLTALSGAKQSLAQEAIAANKWVGVVNSSTITEPGTGAFLASAPDRKDDAAIALQIARSGARVILGGGEQWFVPKGARGRHGPGSREDGLDLVAELRAKGYAVVFTRDELAAVPADATRVLGLFAHDATFNDEPEEVLQREGRPLYQPQAPTSGEMVRFALGVLARAPQGFLLVLNEEGSDNFGGPNNAQGVFEAVRRTNDAIGAALTHLKRFPDTLVLVASDSASGGMQVLGDTLEERKPDEPLPQVEENGAPTDGRDGTHSRPFLAAPDRNGVRLPFRVAWATGDDGSANVVARAAGLNANFVSGSFSNVDVYRVMYLTLFGRELPATP